MNGVVGKVGTGVFCLNRVAGGEEAIGWRTLLALSCEGRFFRPARRTKLASGEGFQGTCLKVVRLNRCFIPQASE